MENGSAPIKSWLKDDVFIILGSGDQLLEVRTKEYKAQLVVASRKAAKYVGTFVIAQTPELGEGTFLFGELQ